MERKHMTIMKRNVGRQPGQEPEQSERLWKEQVRAITPHRTKTYHKSSCMPNLFSCESYFTGLANILLHPLSKTAAPPHPRLSYCCCQWVFSRSSACSCYKVLFLFVFWIMRFTLKFLIVRHVSKI